MSPSMKIPHGVALVRVETPLGSVVVVSDRLSSEEERTARIIAADRVSSGSRAVVLGELEVARVLHDSAA